MSFWIELRCDKRISEANCWSDGNNGPMQLAPSSLHVPVTVRAIEDEGRRQGWIKYRGAWTCPACAQVKKEA